MEDYRKEVRVTEAQGQGMCSVWNSGDTQREGRCYRKRGALGIKWETMKMGQIRVRPQSLTEQFGCDGAGHGALIGF